ncbi:MAG: HAD-superfamily hydrolase, subfamily variant 3 [Bacillales bacterium]|nr:HAD-superfamily hydrolase, subfamily variant 3 [Bacillales bacterium]
MILVFDLGNVLMKFEMHDFLSNVLEDKSIVDEVYETIFKSEEWLLLDQGMILIEDAFAIFKERKPHLANEIQFTFDNWMEQLVPVEKNTTYLKVLKEMGYELYFLSNYHEVSSAYCFDKFDFFKLFDGGVWSHAVKINKPDRRIYEVLLERYNLTAENCLFIDDVEENCEVARTVGMNAVCYNRHMDLQETLKPWLYDSK